jgi:hypothetical protein
MLRKYTILYLLYIIGNSNNALAQRVALGITYDPLNFHFANNSDKYFNNSISYCGIIHFDSSNIGVSIKSAFIEKEYEYLTTDLFLLNVAALYIVENSKKTKLFVGFNGAWGFDNQKFELAFKDNLGNIADFTEEKKHLHLGIGFELISIMRLVDNLYFHIGFGITRQLNAKHSFSNKIEKILSDRPFDLNKVDLNLGLIYQIY